jgi:hypothetical protein
MVLMTTPTVTPQFVKPKALNCPNCGAPVELRGFAHTLNVVCPNCHSILDASTPEFTILQTLQRKERIEPQIPLGTRGKFNGQPYQVIGFQVREVDSEGSSYSWDEYLLFNPYYGFRYLTEYEGHWNFVRVLSALPVELNTMGKPAVEFQGRRYRHFDSLSARTNYILGEFPWQVRVGDVVQDRDFVSPPYMLSAEATPGEITWSLGEYTSGKQIWAAFQLPGSPPAYYGVFPNQPSPYEGKPAAFWSAWLWLNVALLAIALFFTMSSADREVFQNTYLFTQGAKTEAAFVTPDFELTGRPSNVEISIRTDLNNNWAYFNFALINEDTGQDFDFGREVSYYRDSDGAEGKPNDSVIVPRVPSGKYYLRVEPEMEPRILQSMSYSLTIRRDVPSNAFFWIAGVLLLIPPVFITFRASAFESARWRESDYAPAVKSGSGGGGDDD